jgi:hypothetical protein
MNSFTVNRAIRVVLRQSRFRTADLKKKVRATASPGLMAKSRGPENLVRFFHSGGTAVLVGSSEMNAIDYWNTLRKAAKNGLRFPVSLALFRIFM